MSFRSRLAVCATAFTAATLVLLAASVAQAQQVVLYGLIDASGSRVRPIGGDWQWRLDSGNLSPSFIGFRGVEDLGGGLRAVFRLESHLGVDTGQAGLFGSEPFFGRESSVGLSGAFGTTVLGRTISPLYATVVAFNPFGESPGFSPARRHWFGSSTSGGGGVIASGRSWTNSMNYANNPRDPLRINLAANVPENASSNTEPGNNVGGSVSYILGPFAATVALERIKNSSSLAAPAGFRRQLAGHAAITYDFRIVRLYGQAGRVKTDAASDSRTTLWHVGAAVPFGTHLILASYGQTRTRDELSRTSDRIAALGYDYFLSKNTDLYVAASYEKLSFTSPSGASYAGGIRHRF